MHNIPPTESQMDPMQELQKQASLQVQSQDNGMNSQNETCYCDPHTVKDSLEENSVPPT